MQKVTTLLEELGVRIEEPEKLLKELENHKDTAPNERAIRSIVYMCRMWNLNEKEFSKLVIECVKDMYRIHTAVTSCVPSLNAFVKKENAPFWTGIVKFNGDFYIRERNGAILEKVTSV